MNSYEWEWLLNKDDTLCFFPVGHSVEGNYKIHFELSGSCNLRVSVDWPPESPDNQYHLNK